MGSGGSQHINASYFVRKHHDLTADWCVVLSGCSENEEKRRAAEARKRAANARWEERERKRKLARAAAGINAEAQEGGEDGVDEDAGDEHRD